MWVFSFPNPVDEHAARTVAGGVLLMSVAALAFRQPLVLIPLAYGFWARVLTGPAVEPARPGGHTVGGPPPAVAAEAGGRTAQALRPGHGDGHGHLGARPLVRVR